MTPSDYALAMGMFVSGTFNTLAAKWCQQTLSEGDVGPTTIWGNLAGDAGGDENCPKGDGIVVPRAHEFDHPFFQATGMFLGEALCMVVYLIKKYLDNRSNALNKRQIPKKNSWASSFVFAIPATLDMTGTGIMNAGLCLVDASVFQMLRSAVVVFTALLSILILKKKLRAFHWVAIYFIIMGVAIVGYVSIYYKDDDQKKDDEANTDLQCPLPPEGATPSPTPVPTTSDNSAALLGTFLVIFAQFMVAIQMIVEEKIINKYGAPALKAVGCEGIFGFLILGTMLIPLSQIKVDGYALEAPIDALKQVSNNWQIQLSLVLYTCSIAFFNFFGISVTKSMSASHRMVLDSLRTAAIWAVGLLLGWERFHFEKLFGFVCLLIGTAMYNEILTIPALFNYNYDEDEAPRESFMDNVRRDSKVDDEEEPGNISANAPLLQNV